MNNGNLVPRQIIATRADGSTYETTVYVSVDQAHGLEEAQNVRIAHLPMRPATLPDDRTVKDAEFYRWAEVHAYDDEEEVLDVNLFHSWAGGNYPRFDITTNDRDRFLDSRGLPFQDSDESGDLSAFRVADRDVLLYRLKSSDGAMENWVHVSNNVEYAPTISDSSYIAPELKDTNSLWARIRRTHDRVEVEVTNTHGEREWYDVSDITERVTMNDIGQLHTGPAGIHYDSQGVRMEPWPPHAVLQRLSQEHGAFDSLS